MKQTTLILLFCLYALAGAAQSNKTMTLEEVVTGQFAPKNIQGVTPIPGDDEHYAQLNAERTQIVKYAFRTGKAVEVLFDAETARECPFKTIDSYSFSPDGTKLLIATDTKPVYRRSYTAVHYLYSLRRNIEGKINNVVERLSDGGPQQAPVFSPDGNMVAFVRDNNIYLVKLLYGNSESQVTDDGQRNRVLNGIPDWVYEEEFAYNRALEFSADSKMLAFVRFDESEVPSFSFPLYGGEAPHQDEYALYPGFYTYKYPKTGEQNSRVSVHTFDIKSKVTRRIDVPMDEGGYIPRICFTQDPDKLAIVTLNRHQNRLDLYFANPRSTVCKLVLRDESDTYIKESTFDFLRFYADGFTFASEKSGFNHLYWYDMNGALKRQVTAGNYEVTAFLGYDAEEGTFYYASNEESPLRRAIYKTDRKGKKTKLSTQAGTNTALFGSGMKYYLNRYSDLNTPTVTTLNDNKGRTLATLEDNQALRHKLAAYDLPRKEFFTFTTSDGVELNGWMMKPAGFDESRKYPVLMYQYSGPGSQQVLDAFSISWETYMAASQGYVVACVDGRGTGGRGAAFEKCTYLSLGVKEARDQAEAARYLGSLPFVDKENIGIWGWSYGGYMTLMSMSQGEASPFKAGAAVAAVTDWKYYDTIYGERFMRTPQENADGYRQASAIERAGQLKGALLLVHGTADDNVHYQNCAEYSERLVQLGKQFEQQIYTNRNHGISGGNTRLHLYTRLTDFFNEKLK